MTGRAAGYCAGYPAPGYTSFGGGRGFWGWGRGGGGGWGWRNRYYATGLTGWQRAATGWPPYAGAAPVAPYGYGAAPSAQQELDALKGQAEYFEDALDGIRKRIGELEAKANQG